MINPENVNPNNFKVSNIIYNNGAFSVAIGKWHDTPDVLAMRWNGEDGDDKGYPKTFGHAMWFIIDSDLREGFIQAVVNKNNLNNILKTKKKT